MGTALITGINGQDGSYLADLLLGKGYSIIGVLRPGVAAQQPRIAHPGSRIIRVECDLCDSAALRQLLRAYRPSEVYNLAARASSSQLADDPVNTGEVNGLAVTRLLEAIRAVDANIRFCQASSSELFGFSRESPQSESTPFHPRNPYGVAKLYAHWSTVNHREIFGLFGCSAILFNHESPRRGPEFVTRKITRAVARIKAGLQADLHLGDLEARRDWGYAGDFVRALWMMLQAPVAADYVIATGEVHSVRELCELAFARVSLDYRRYVVESSQMRRPAETLQLVGNPCKARTVLGWTPSVSFAELIGMMVDADVAALAQSN
jgi:GDPmannose 4,6-dehydratase